jgi:hypothetical protein
MNDKSLDLSKLPRSVIDQLLLMMRQAQQNAKNQLLAGVPKEQIAASMRGRVYGDIDLDEYLALDTDEKILALCSKHGAIMLRNQPSQN